MMDDCPPVTVSRRIAAPAAAIFGVLTDPVRHLDLDGSGMLRGAASTAPVTGVGDVFVMKMYFAALGDYEMNNHVVEYEPDRRIGWEPAAGRGHPESGPAEDSRWGQRWTYELTPDGPDATVVTEVYDCSRVPAAERAGMDNGRAWIGSMAQTLERLDRICTGH
jgi:Polyketide cyclase / dehydrase and lipid transport